MSSSIRDADIAIIGMACRFPGATNLATFWRNLCEGIESISFFENEQLSTKDSFSDGSLVQAGATLDDVELFDANFFNYSTQDAEITDPQHRFFLECSWEAIEDAGYNPYSYKGLIGVYAGVGLNTYLINNILPNHELKHKNFLGSILNLKMMIGNDKDYLPTQVSYKLNLRGPSVNVQTACSTSLVAVHIACQSILNGECDMALAGAANIIVPQKTGYYYQEGMMFSPDGHCRTFDSEAQGTVFGSGVGVVLLKSLQKAIEDGDSVYAVIKGTAINNDGAMKVGYTTPSVEGQASVIQEALAVSEINSETISYVEAHGTATPLGDPIEVAALTQAFNSSKRSYCAIGSVKTNFGHLGWAAGIAGLIKTVLSLQHKQIPPSLHYKKPNPRIDFDNSPFYMNTELKDWITSGIQRRAGVSAFGIGGTNAHAVLEEAPKRVVEKKIKDLPYHLLTLSAKTQQGLLELANRYKDVVTSMPDNEIQNICFTSNVGRNHFNQRLAIMTSSCNDVCEKLENYVELKSKQISTTIDSKPKDKKIAFLFSGEGTQYFGMGRQLYETQPVFRKTMDQCNALFKEIRKMDLLDIIYSTDTHDTRLNSNEFLQPALYSLQLALVNLWKYYGIKPDFILGDGLGECAAACVSGVFSLADGFKIVIQRAILMQSLLENIEIDFMLQDFKKTLNNIIFLPPRIKIISSVTGLLIDKDITTPEYWHRYIQTSLKFREGIDILGSSEISVFIEIGPKQILLELAQQWLSNLNAIWIPSLCEGKNDWEVMLTSLGELYVHGCQIDWNLFHKGYSRQTIHLPTYPFQRQRYWVG